MKLTALFGTLEGLLVLAFVANRLFRRSRIPDVVVLMATGLVLGPVLGWVYASRFEGIAHAFGTLALILVTTLLVVLGTIRARRHPAVSTPAPAEAPAPPAA